MASWQEEPRTGHSVWHNHKNGVINNIDYRERIIYVNFYDKGRGEFTFDDFLGTFDEALNQWVIVEA